MERLSELGKKTLTELVEQLPKMTEKQQCFLFGYALALNNKENINKEDLKQVA